MIPMFEKDPNQEDVPVGHVAYLLRFWTAIYDEGRVTKVALSGFGLPHLYFDSGGSMRRPKYAGEYSRLFVREDAPIDPRVFEIDAGPVPADVMTRNYGPKK